MVRGHKQTRKDIHGFLRYAERGERGAAIARRIIAQLMTTGRARSIGQNPSDKKTGRVDAVSPEAARAGRHWSKTSKNACISVTLSLSAAAVFIQEREGWMRARLQPKKDPSGLKNAKERF